jgi:2-oxoisovalerate dehydrogenase E2 component (dihydrolipoyl transacylase)
MEILTFKLPDLGEGVVEAQIVRWLVKVGDQVEQDQPVCEVQTDKAIVEIPAPQAGRMIEIYWNEGDWIPVRSDLFALAKTEPSSQTIMQKKKKVLAAPSVRRLARQWGIELEKVVGSGPNGRILEQDIRKYAKSEQSSDKMIEQVESLSAIRQVIAKRLSFSVTHKPHVTHFDEIDAEGLVEWRNKCLRERDPSLPRLTYLPILLKILSHTLLQHPRFNAHFDEETKSLQTFTSVSIGIAVDTPQGLLVPVAKHVEQKTIKQLAIEVNQLIQQAREGKLTPQQMKGGTFTISNTGGLGGEWATPIIHPPEVAIIVTHPIKRKPIVTADGQIVPAWRMNVSLSFDHRVLDGSDAIRFTQTLAKYTADPTRLMNELV